MRSRLLSLLSFAIAGALSPYTAYSLELKHTPPVMRSNLGIVTLEVIASEAQDIRLLGISPTTGITARALKNESGVFRLRTPGRDLVGHQYTFQVRTKSGEVIESKPYNISDDFILAQNDELTTARLNVEALDREISKQRRILTSLRNESRIMAPGDQLRQAAQDILNQKETAVNDPGGKR